MNKKGFELAISTIVIIVLGILVLIGLVYAVTDGFKRLKGTTDPIRSSALIVFKQSCEISCQGEDSLSYCCNTLDYDEEGVYCYDERLELDCYMDCAGIECEE